MSLLFVAALASLLPAGGEPTGPIASQFVAIEAAPPKTRDRYEFAKAFSRVEGKMAAAEVLAILGTPDDIGKVSEPGWPTDAPLSARELWAYGTDGHFAFPTLGCIYIDKTGKAIDDLGDPETKRPLPQKAVMPEEELRKLLRLLHTAPDYGTDFCNPLPVIQIVNALQPLGKERALAAIEEYFRMSDLEGSERLYPVLLTLFEVPPEGFFKPCTVVQPRAPRDPRRIPRFPVAIVKDVPFLLAMQGNIAGEGHWPWDDPMLAYLRKHGRLRAHPLKPADAPLSVFDEFESKLLWFYEDSKEYLPIPPPPTPEEARVFGKKEIINQLLRLVDSVYRLEPDQQGRRFTPGKDVDRDWEKLAEELRKLQTRWDEKKNCYTLADGSTLPPAAIYLPITWPLEGIVGEGSFVLKRINRQSVNVSFGWYGVYEAAKMPEIRVFSVKDPKVTLATLRISLLGNPPTANPISETTGIEIKLSEGEQLQVELVQKGSSQRSPVFKP